MRDPLELLTLQAEKNRAKWFDHVKQDFVTNSEVIWDNRTVADVGSSLIGTIPGSNYTSATDWITATQTQNVGTTHTVGKQGTFGSFTEMLIKELDANTIKTTLVNTEDLDPLDKEYLRKVGDQMRQSDTD